MKALEVVYAMLEIAEQLPTNEEYYKAFEQSKCIDSVEDCQYSKNEDIIKLSQ